MQALYQLSYVGESGGTLGTRTRNPGIIASLPHREWLERVPCSTIELECQDGASERTRTATTLGLSKRCHRFITLAKWSDTRDSNSERSDALRVHALPFAVNPVPENFLFASVAYSQVPPRLTSLTPAKALQEDGQKVVAPAGIEPAFRG